MRTRQNVPSRHRSLITEKNRSRRYGDLRPLGFCVGILLLCLVGVLLSPKGLSEEASPSLSATVAADSVVDMQAIPETTWEGTVVEDPVSRTARPIPLEEESEESVGAWPSDPEDQERVFNEMAEQMPDGAVIIF